jgi:hypothetical protein
MPKNINAFFSRYEFLLPLFIFILFLGASLPGIEWGAPALWNPDELVWRVNNALRGELIFDETEPDWNYPSLPKYVMYAIGWLVKSTGRSEFAIIVSLRMFSAFLGALSGVLIYYLARNIGANKSVSLLAGIFYIVSGIAAENGRLAHNDLYLQLFSVLCVFFVIKYQQTKKLAWLFASFFSVGLAASSKFTGGSFILLPICVFIIEQWGPIRSRLLNIFLTLLKGGFVSFLGYALGTPKALFSPVYYFTNVFVALRNYPQYGFNSGAPIGLFGQWGSFEDAVGIFAYYLFLFSLVWFLIRYMAWKFGIGQIEQNQAQAVFILMLAVLIFDLPFLMSINYIPRYFIPFVPFLSILAALMVYEIWTFSKQHQMKFIPPILVVILVVGVSYSTLRLVSIALLFMNDARIPATEYIATIRGYQKSIEYTLYPPDIEKRKFERAHNYPIYFVKYPSDVVPTGGRYEYNQGEQGLLERDTDYFVIDSYTYDRFFTESICVTNPVECDFFKRLLANEIETFRLIKKFNYTLPAYLPRVSVTAVNPDMLMFERIR